MEPSIYKTDLERNLIEKIEPVVTSLGLGLRDVEYLRGAGTIRVTLDPPPGRTEQISIDDCSRAHQILGPLFDVWDPIESAYTLECSSPGEKPNLRTLRHFEEARGHKVRIQTLEALVQPAPAKPRRNWEGTLKDLHPEAGEVVLEDSLGLHSLKLEQMKNAVWLREWGVSPEARGGNKKKKTEK